MQTRTSGANPSHRGNCRFDVELEITFDNPLKFIEYKALVSPSSINLNQFKAYLSNINSLSELNYVFSNAKLGGNRDQALASARRGMKNFLKNNAKEIWNANPNLFKNKFRKTDSSRFIEEWDDLYDLLNDKDFDLTHKILSFIDVN